MVEFSTQSFQRIAQSMDIDYDDKVDRIHEIFRQPFISGALTEVLDSVSERVRDIGAYDLLNQLDSETNTAWTNAIANFVDELEAEGFDVSNIDVVEVAQRLKSSYVNELREGLRDFFDDWFSRGIEGTVADNVASELITSILGEPTY